MRLPEFFYYLGVLSLFLRPLVKSLLYQIAPNWPLEAQVTPQFGQPEVMHPPLFEHVGNKHPLQTLSLAQFELLTPILLGLLLCAFLLEEVPRNPVRRRQHLTHHELLVVGRGPNIDEYFVCIQIVDELVLLL